ncbi:hypothetical protein GUJ93_ZPchr0004g38495 [Zizania palustris]|uniref:Uncharacterized protein n=1 Tax=Zizania palustris TaxID=103762 RepID=A0A8J5VAP8_ZIZPA|nr:hypothetical protein GUJ93_ZPchr0004g38495 [Zizania palustris]
MALRRLAHGVLHHHRVGSVAHPRPLPAFLSYESRVPLLRFFTSSSTTPAPHFMVEYLVSTCGLSLAAAVKAAPRFAHLGSTSRPDAVRAFLRAQGLSRAEVRAVVSWLPTVLLSNVDATLYPKFNAVRALGLGRADAARLFALYPPALTYGIHSNLLPRVLFWLDLLGSTKLLMKWLNKVWLLQYSVDLLLRNMYTLRSLGVPDDRITTTVRLQPALIMPTPAKFQKLIDKAALCGITPSSGMYMWVLFTLRNVSEGTFRAKKAAVMSATGCTEQEFAAMFRRAPCFMGMPAELLRQKVEFLVATARCTTEYIVKNPVLLTFSLSKRMVPRCRVIETLQSRGIDIRKRMNVSTIMKLSEAKFVERFILRHKQEVPELLELYPPRHGKGRSQPR